MELGQCKVGADGCVAAIFTHEGWETPTAYLTRLGKARVTDRATKPTRTRSGVTLEQLERDLANSPRSLAEDARLHRAALAEVNRRNAQLWKGRGRHD